MITEAIADISKDLDAIYGTICNVDRTGLQLYLITEEDKNSDWSRDRDLQSILQQHKSTIQRRERTKKYAKKN